MNRSKPAWNCVIELRALMSTSSKLPTHYEVLNVQQNSTQEDIKSAYYELSKKFHPDRNTSVDAKKNFQNVSDAYEILGNYEKRKLYDRNLAARGSKATVRRTYQPPTEDPDPVSKFYKSRMTNYAQGRYQQNFDFDEWTRAHYGRALDRVLEKKYSEAIARRRKRQHEEQVENDKSTLRFITFTASLVTISLIVQSYFIDDNYDKNLISREKKKDS